MAQFDEEKQARKLAQLRAEEEEASVKMFADKYSLPYADLSTYPVELDALKIVPEEKARRVGLAVFRRTGKDISVAVKNPNRDEVKGLLKELETDGYRSELYLVSGRSLEKVFAYYEKVPVEGARQAGAIEVSNEKITALQKEIKSVSEIKARIDPLTKARTTEILEVIIAGALAVDSSDIHIEPRKEDVRIRFRLDGVLFDITAIPASTYKPMLSRIKLVSELKLNVHDSPQDGRFTIRTEIGDIEIRTSILPGPDGENIVMRVLNPKSIRVGFGELGMQPWVQEAMRLELKKPNGMILTTGPTGSGKTTTLYTFLQTIHTPEIKIITLEDPIEYHLPGIEQTQIAAEKGYDFASGLRAILRQDPDVILVGEVRDKETAETAIHAALTGHLVFSTLHTNNAAGTVPRLLDLEVKAASIAPAINVSMAQRLVRKLCLKCRGEANLSAKEKEALQKELASLPKGVPAPEESGWTVFKASDKGCESCHGGYKGRTGVYEIIRVNDKIEELIMKEPSEYDIKKAAREQGEITMREDGILKVLAGITDLAELERVLGEE